MHLSRPNRIILSEPRCLSTIWSVTTFPKILKFAIVGLASTNLLHIPLSVINSPVRLVMTTPGSTNLIWTIPLIARCPQTIHLVVLHVSRLVAESPNWLRHVVRTHRWVSRTADATIVLIEVDLVHIADATLPHLVLRGHRHVSMLAIAAVRVLRHNHLLHCWVAVVV